MYFYNLLLVHVKWYIGISIQSDNEIFLHRLKLQQTADTYPGLTWTLIEN